MTICQLLTPLIGKGSAGGSSLQGRRGEPLSFTPGALGPGLPRALKWPAGAFPKLRCGSTARKARGSTFSSAPASGSYSNRLEADVVLFVTKLDRLGRNVIDVRQTVDQLAERSVKVHCLALGCVDLTSPAGKMTMGVLAAVAEFERDLLRERTAAGTERARAEGKQPGRPSRLTSEERTAIKARLAAGATVYGLAQEYGVDRRVIHRARDAS
ncbi:recombinase family protein [Methylocystis echinoides]|uniref:recombinase family protein n=1 Tax=Methylocystis echinoides TaxID=29468 RepID=UPI003443ECAD